jgi:hypothetical protein
MYKVFNRGRRGEEAIILETKHPYLQLLISLSMMKNFARTALATQAKGIWLTKVQF